MKVSVDLDLCQGHGRCYTLAPNIFEDDAAGYPVVKPANFSSPDVESDAQRAAGACPESAIHLLTDDDAAQSREGTQ